MNSPREPIRLRDEDDRFIRVKDLDIEIDAKTPRSRQNSFNDDHSTLSSPQRMNHKTSRVHGARIEFTTLQDKRLFMDKVREVQEYSVAG